MLLPACLTKRWGIDGGRFVFEVVALTAGAGGSWTRDEAFVLWPGKV